MMLDPAHRLCMVGCVSVFDPKLAVIKRPGSKETSRSRKTMQLCLSIGERFVMSFTLGDTGNERRHDNHADY